jgi:3-methyl-2-oxobutanoate hydroxymethyltransferase
MSQAMQAERVSGFKEYIEDVRSGGFPAPEHIIPAADSLISAFIDSADD